ncbi:MAG: MBL fold metallo-hydrolase [Desulfobacterales bacterium]|nr:MBL fold metallo-hydrolase [Desulfobacterales bacterium]
MKLYSILGNFARLDGGAMFGNIPKAVWSRWMRPDEFNRLPVGSRALLAITENHKVLFETGFGAFMEPRLRERLGMEESAHILLESLEKTGVSHEEITEIILSHLHFDHAGGLLSAWKEGEAPELLFPNATCHVSEPAWERATRPHFRDRASFSPLINEKLKNSKRLALLDSEDTLAFDELKIHFFESNGHTPGMLCADLRWDEKRLVFGADLIPSRFCVHLPVTSGFDRFPELLIDEKEVLLKSLAEENAWLFYTHDPEIAVSKVRIDGETKKMIAVESHKKLEFRQPT